MSQRITIGFILIEYIKILILLKVISYNPKELSIIDKNLE